MVNFNRRYILGTLATASVGFLSSCGVTVIISGGGGAEKAAERDRRAKSVMSRLYGKYEDTRKYTFGLEQPRGEDYTHQVFRFVERMGGADFLESGSPEFIIQVSTKVEAAAGDYHKVSAQVLLVDSKTISGGKIVHMSGGV
jgi:hypothetical protein